MELVTSQPVINISKLKTYRYYLELYLKSPTFVVHITEADNAFAQQAIRAAEAHLTSQWSNEFSVNIKTITAHFGNLSVLRDEGRREIFSINLLKCNIFCSLSFLSMPTTFSSSGRRHCRTRHSQYHPFGPAVAVRLAVGNALATADGDRVLCNRTARSCTVCAAHCGRQCQYGMSVFCSDATGEPQYAGGARTGGDCATGD